MFTYSLIPEILRTCALASYISHKSIESLLSLTYEFVERFEIRLTDIFQDSRINQVRQCFVQFAACNGVIVQAVKVMITAIRFSDISCYSFGSSTDLNIQIILLIHRQILGKFMYLGHNFEGKSITFQIFKPTLPLLPWRLIQRLLFTHTFLLVYLCTCL